MDELWEALSWAQLGYHSKPVGLFNALGFYDGLVAFYRHMTQTGFIRPAHGELLVVGTSIEALLAAMADSAPPRTVLQMSVDEL